MKFDDERLLVQKAAFLRDPPSENEHGNFCEKASFECTDCLLHRLPVHPLSVHRLLVHKLPVHQLPVRRTGCLFASYIWYRMPLQQLPVHQLSVQILSPVADLGVQAVYVL